MKKVNFKRCVQQVACCIFFLLLLGTKTFSQTPTLPTKKITGKVVNSTDGKPMAGVSILVKGTKTGTQTNQDGEFTLSVNDKDVLQVSFVGYELLEVTIGKKSRVDINLVNTDAKLDDVVVIGYGKARRKDVTGSISSITGDEIRKTQPTTIDQALQGKVPGVVVQQISGQPGGGVSIQINGLTSFSNNPPLYVIDGVFIGTAAIDGSGTNPLSSINPSEVESIDVLKDASATAIYGSQATNGVIVITTKRGKISPPKITYDFYAGSQSLPKYYETMNLRDYATFMNAKSAIIGFDLRPQFANPQYLGEGTNWQKELFRNAPMTNHSIGISGGDARTQYFISGSYFSQEGIALGSDFKRYSLRFNIDNKTTDWLKIGTSLQLANVKEKVVTTNAGVIQTALIQTPDVAAQNPDGSYGGNDVNIYGAYASNPFALAQIRKDDKKRYQIFGNLYADISITKKISLRNEVSGDFDFGTQDQFTPTYRFGQVVNPVATAFYSSAQSSRFVARTFLTYNNTFKKNLYLNAMVGHESQLQKSENAAATRNTFPSNNVQTINAGDPTTATNRGDQFHSALESYFGRINVTYKDKYLYTLNIRSDGSSKFSPENRWVVTYSNAFSWRAINEKFIKDLNIFSDLKVKIGYGLTNNQNIRDNAYFSTLATAANGLSGIAQQTVNLANPDIKWETTKMLNVGLDVAFLKNRIQLSLDVYDRKTDGLLIAVPLPTYSGTATGYSPGSLQAPISNVGSVSNKGVSFALTTQNIKSKSATGFNWTSNFTLSHNVNKVLSINGDENAALYGYAGATAVAKSIVGRPLGDFFGFQTDGIFMSAADFKNHPAIPVNSTTGVPLPIVPTTGGVWIGDVMFRDVNGDGVINEKDQTFLGSPRPKFQLGFNNTFSYKNFDLNIFMSSNIGNKVYNQISVNADNPNQNFGYFKSVLDFAKIGKIDPSGSASDINNVYIINPGTNIVRVSTSSGNDNQRFSDRYVEDGSFVRCRSIALGYTFQKKLLQKAHINSLRIYANMTNVFILTKYKGYDPEIGSYDPLVAGVDNGYYPQPRVFTIGANISLN